VRTAASRRAASDAGAGGAGAGPRRAGRAARDRPGAEHDELGAAAGAGPARLPNVRPAGRRAGLAGADGAHGAWADPVRAAVVRLRRVWARLEPGRRDAGAGAAGAAECRAAGVGRRARGRDRLPAGSPAARHGHRPAGQHGGDPPAQPATGGGTGCGPGRRQRAGRPDAGGRRGGRPGAGAAAGRGRRGAGPLPRRLARGQGRAGGRPSRRRVGRPQLRRRARERRGVRAAAAG
jgi:hypothetical protein